MKGRRQSRKEGEK